MTCHELPMIGLIVIDCLASFLRGRNLSLVEESRMRGAGLHVALPISADISNLK